MPPGDVAVAHQLPAQPPQLEQCKAIFHARRIVRHQMPGARFERTWIEDAAPKRSPKAVGHKLAANRIQPMPLQFFSRLAGRDIPAVERAHRCAHYDIGRELAAQGLPRPGLIRAEHTASGEN